MNQNAVRSYPWLPASVLVGGLAGLFNWLTGQGGSESAAFALGVALGQTVILWLALLLTGLQRSGAGGVAGAFAVVWLMASCGTLPAMRSETRGMATAVTEPAVTEPAVTAPDGPKLSDHVDRMRENAKSPTLDNLPLIEEAPAGSSDVEIARQFGTRVLNAMVDDRNAYLAELRAVGWERILSTHRLSKDTGMVASRQMLSHARAAGERNCVGYRERHIAHAQRIATEMNISQRARKDMIDGFIRGLDKSAVRNKEMCAMEFQIYDEVSGVIDVFARDQGWYAENDQFLFTTDAYAEEFNRRMQNIDAISKRQEALQEEALAEGQKQLRSVGM